MINIWTKLRDISVSKIKDKFIEKSHMDMKCPVCNTWISEVDGCGNYIDDPDSDVHSIMTCKKCNFTSRWFVGAPVLISDESYKPTKIEDGIEYVISIKKVKL